MIRPIGTYGWAAILRLGLVQSALGAVFVLATSTLNRVMTVELALPAILPGCLVGLHYLVQASRPLLGWGADRDGNRSTWVIGGMVVLAAGGFCAALATALMAKHVVLGILFAVPSFLMIGGGVAAAGTTLLVMLAAGTAPHRRGAAAATVWVMMIVGFVATAATVGHLLDPFSPGRLIGVSALVSIASVAITLAALYRLEPTPAPAAKRTEVASESFRASLAATLADPQARRFASFIFVSMLAYGGEELLIEPFAGTIAGLTPGATAKLAGMFHGGALAGMLLVGLSGFIPRVRSMLDGWMIGGCLLSGMALVALALCGLSGASDHFALVLFGLGAANGAYAVAAIGTMMRLVSRGGSADHAGTRMGVWGAAQALAFGAGGLVATSGSDALRHFFAPATAYGVIFVAQAIAFCFAALLAAFLVFGTELHRPRGRLSIGARRVLGSS